MNKIYVFSNVSGGGDGICYAMADDGKVLGSHYCSHEAFAPQDLGMIDGTRADRHETYAKHFPDGYEMEFVRSSDVRSHPELSKAFILNQAAGAEAKTETQGEST